MNCALYIQLPEVTKFEDILSGWFACIQHLAHIWWHDDMIKWHIWWQEASQTCMVYLIFVVSILTQLRIQTKQWKKESFFLLLLQSEPDIEAHQIREYERYWTENRLTYVVCSQSKLGYLYHIYKICNLPNSIVANLGWRRTPWDMPFIFSGSSLKPLGSAKQLTQRSKYPSQV